MRVNISWKLWQICTICLCIYFVLTPSNLKDWKYILEFWFEFWTVNHKSRHTLLHPYFYSSLGFEIYTLGIFFFWKVFFQRFSPVCFINEKKTYICGFLSFKFSRDLLAPPDRRAMKNHISFHQTTRIWVAK